MNFFTNKYCKLETQIVKICKSRKIPLDMPKVAAVIESMTAFFLKLPQTFSLLKFTVLCHNFCCCFSKGSFLYYIRVKGWVGGIAKYLLLLTGVGGWFWITLT